MIIINVKSELHPWGGRLRETTYHRKREQYLVERADIENQVKQHLVADDKYVDFRCLILDVANRASDIYQVRKPEEKKYLCNLIFSNLFLADKTVKFSLNTIFQAVLQHQKSGDELALGNVFRTYEWLKPYQSIDLTFITLQQILQTNTEGKYPLLPPSPKTYIIYRNEKLWSQLKTRG